MCTAAAIPRISKFDCHARTSDKIPSLSSRSNNTLAGLSDNAGHLTCRSIVAHLPKFFQNCRHCFTNSLEDSKLWACQSGPRRLPRSRDHFKHRGFAFHKTPPFYGYFEELPLHGVQKIFNAPRRFNCLAIQRDFILFDETEKTLPTWHLMEWNFKEKIISTLRKMIFLPGISWEMYINIYN